MTNIDLQLSVINQRVGSPDRREQMTRKIQRSFALHLLVPAT